MVSQHSPVNTLISILMNRCIWYVVHETDKFLLNHNWTLNMTTFGFINNITNSYSPAASAYRLLSVRHLFSFVVSWHGETKELPHIGFKSCCSIGNFTNLATCSIRHFHSTTGSAWVSAVQRMLGMKKPVIALDPASLCCALVQPSMATMRHCGLLRLPLHPYRRQDWRQQKQLITQLQNFLRTIFFAIWLTQSFLKYSDIILVK